MKTLRFLCAVTLLALAPACATAKAPATEAAHHVDPSAAVIKPGEAKLGDSTVCPVSGEHFTVDASSPKVEYQGKTYFFCCNDCVADFQKNPEKFVAKLNQ